MSLTREINFNLNGSPVRVTVPVTMNTLTLLRERLNLTGTKYGCGEGECGACTILMDGKSVNACLMFAVDCDGRQLTTVEGLLTDSDNDSLRNAFADKGAVQCGFCSPGMMMQATHILQQNPDADRWQIQRGLEGNLCRCTGYKKIVDAVVSVSKQKD
ncbi:MAG: (2Fe-2S)-binding protein [Gammaproteobacteria bacterium]|nr:(2Fe-2S)-binding protein [Gammaproteobacteria bacterium]